MFPRILLSFVFHSKPDYAFPLDKATQQISVQIIDKKWLDQLETLEGLREAVALRSYGSKNPLTEYKIDGFNIFDDMLTAIRLTVMSRVFKVRIQLSPEAAEQRKRMIEAQKQQMNNVNAQHNESSSSFAQQSAAVNSQNSARSSFNGDMARRQAVNSATNQRSQGDNITVRRTMPKVGRNDPCPCGSGKKYKQCCGR